MVNPFILQATDAMTQIILGIHTLLLGTVELDDTTIESVEFFWF